MISLMKLKNSSASTFAMRLSLVVFLVVLIPMLFFSIWQLFTTPQTTAYILLTHFWHAAAAWLLVVVDFQLLMRLRLLEVRERREEIHRAIQHKKAQESEVISEGRL